MSFSCLQKTKVPVLFIKKNKIIKEICVNILEFTSVVQTVSERVRW